VTSVTNDPVEHGPASGCRHRNPNRLGIDRGIVRDVIFIAEEKLERVLSEGKHDLRLGLSRAKMQVIKVTRNGLVERRERCVYYKVVMAGIGFLNAGRCYSHVEEAKAYGRPTRYVGSIGRVDEINLSIRGGGMSSWSLWCRGRFDNPDTDTLGHDRRRMRDMSAVSQQKLKRMLARGQIHFSLSLAGAKMQVIEVAWNRLIQRRQLRIDYQMMVSRILSFRSRRRHPHTAKPKMNSRLGRQCVAILKIDEINGSPGG
jgi:hypothetical protein